MARLGVLLGLVMVLSLLEHLFVMPFMPPHVKPGLANVIVMYSVFAMGGRSAVWLVVMKALFVLVTRGLVAGLLSFCGGLLSVGVIILFSTIYRKRLGYAVISVGGALAFNGGQLAVAMVLMATPMLVFYLPLLMVAGIAAGLLTGALLRALMPVLQRLPGALLNPREVRH